MRKRLQYLYHKMMDNVLLYCISGSAIVRPYGSSGIVVDDESLGSTTRDTQISVHTITYGNLSVPVERM
jgi:hypothetical protein